MTGHDSLPWQLSPSGNEYGWQGCLLAEAEIGL